VSLVQPDLSTTERYARHGGQVSDMYTLSRWASCSLPGIWGTNERRRRECGGRRWRGNTQPHGATGAPPRGRLASVASPPPTAGRGICDRVTDHGSARRTAGTRGDARYPQTRKDRAREGEALARPEQPRAATDGAPGANHNTRCLDYRLHAIGGPVSEASSERSVQ
jgi:hypothetical protein